MHAHLFSVISPDSFSFEAVTIPVLVGLFVGGSGKVMAVGLGALVVTGLPEILRAVGSWYMAVYGAGIILVLVYAPGGLAARLRRVPAAESDGVDRVAVEAVSRAVAMAPGAALLSVEGLSKSFGGLLAVDSLSFEVQGGEIKSLIGPNGAGKTTALNLITAVYRADAGRVRLGTADLRGLPSHAIAAAGMLRTFQTIRVWRDLSVRENVMVALHGASRVGPLAVVLNAAPARVEERAMRERATRRSTWSGSGRCATSRRPHCRPASAGSSSWHAVSRPRRASSCWMSRRRGSASRSAGSCSTDWRACAIGARPSSSSSTTCRS